MAWDDSTERRAEGSESADMLRRLEERLERASEAAERLVSEAAQAAAAKLTEPPPPAGWQTPPESGSDGSGADANLDLLLDLAQRLRELVPPELQRRLAEALRELLLAMRALIDWYLQRIEQRRAEPVRAEDIPIL
jgi:hypothetical protein